MTIGEVMRQMRKARGWTLKLAAARMGMDFVSLHRIETGKQRVDEKILNRFGQAYPIRPSELVARAEDGWSQDFSVPPTMRVPVLDIGDITRFLQGEETLQPETFIVAPAEALGARAYAIRMESDAMEPRIPRGASVIIDPDVEPQADAIVCAAIGDDPPILRQLITEAGKRYLRPLNDRYPMTIAGRDYRSLGVVRAITQFI